MIKHRIDSAAACYAHALTIEREAVARYNEFADFLEQQGNAEVAALFRDFARNEAEHEQQLERKARKLRLPALPAATHRWLDDGRCEAPDQTLVWHLMQPWHALRIALLAERHAVGFFEQIERNAPNEEVRRVAQEMADEERGHVASIEQVLQHTPRPHAPDAPVPEAFYG